MTEDAFSCATLLQRVREGCQEAARQLVRNFTPYLLRVAQGCLNRRVRSKASPGDVVQEVWIDFFRNIPGADRLNDEAQLRRFLGTVARRRAFNVNRCYLERSKHDVRRERPLAEAAIQQDRPLRAAEEYDRQAALRELDGLLEGHPFEACLMLALLMFGWTMSQIAEELSVSKKTIRRQLRRFIRKAA